jgi:hypothetical protein
MGEPPQVVESVMDTAGQADTALGLVSKGFLQEAEETSATRDGDGHGSKVSHNLLPFLDRDTFL